MSRAALLPISALILVANNSIGDNEHTFTSFRNGMETDASIVGSIWHRSE